MFINPRFVFACLKPTNDKKLNTYKNTLIHWVVNMGYTKNNIRYKCGYKSEKCVVIDKSHKDMIQKICIKKKNK